MKEHSKQKELTMSTKRIRCLLGANRSGKTVWGAHEASRFLHKNHPVIQFGDEPIGIWIATESYDVQRDVIQPLLKEYLDPERIVGESFAKSNTWSEIRYKADDGTTSLCTFKSYDQGRRKFQGVGKQLIWFDEEPPRDIWEECSVRVRGSRELVDGEWEEKDERRLKIIMTMTPLNGLNWVYDEIYLGTSNPDIHCISVSWRDNPWLSQQDIDEMTRGLNKYALQVRGEGKFVRQTGLVCPWFDRNSHVREFEVLPDWTRYRAIDFGFSAPTCCVWIGVDYHGRWWVYDGIYQPKLTTPELHKAILRKDAKQFITNCFADSAQASDIQELNDLGMFITGVQKQPKESRDSWDEYRARILQEQGKMWPDGLPGIIIHPNLVRIDEKSGKELNWAVKELESVQWDEKVIDGQDKQVPRWGPQDKHFLDALSYFAHEYQKEHKFEEEPVYSDTPKFAVPLYSPMTSDPYDLG